MEDDLRESIRQTFEAIAEHFDMTRYKPWPEIVEFVEELPRKSMLLDIGCGNGRNMILPARLGLKVVGVDFSLKLLKIARKKMNVKGLGQETFFIGGDVSALPLKSETFDSALYIATLHHIPSVKDRVRSLRELKRCLKAGATALISVWALNQPKFRNLLMKRNVDPKYADIFLPWKRYDGKVFQRFYHLFEEDELRQLVIESGLEIEKYFFSSDNYFARVVKFA